MPLRGGGKTLTAVRHRPQTWTQGLGLDGGKRRAQFVGCIVGKVAFPIQRLFEGMKPRKQSRPGDEELVVR